MNGVKLNGKINKLCCPLLWEQLQGTLDRVPVLSQRRLFSNPNNSIQLKFFLLFGINCINYFCWLYLKLCSTTSGGCLRLLWSSDHRLFDMISDWRFAAHAEPAGHSLATNCASKNP